MTIKFVNTGLIRPHMNRFVQVMMMQLVVPSSSRPMVSEIATPKPKIDSKQVTSKPF